MVRHFLEQNVQSNHNDFIHNYLEYVCLFIQKNEMIL